MCSIAPQQVEQLDAEIDRERCYDRGCKAVPTIIYRMRLYERDAWPGLDVRDVAVCPKHSAEARKAGQVLGARPYTEPTP
jgi:hypothetical protein